MTNGNKSAGMPQMGQVNVDINDANEHHCHCGGELFDLVYRYRTLSSLSPKNPTGKDIPIKVETFICRSCEHEIGQPVLDDGKGA